MLGPTSMTAAPDPRQNYLLAALPAEDLERVSKSLKLVELPLGEALYESGSHQRAVYFPTTAIVSLLYTLADGSSSGNCRGRQRRDHRRVALHGRRNHAEPGGGAECRLRLSMVSASFSRRVHARRAMQHLLLRYTQALLTQMAQTAVCNRHHSLDQQLCRWLLLSLDRLVGNELVMTQELIANMLGVRREGVTEAAGNLQDAGLIKYSRGRIKVLDRLGLEARTCECYAVVKKEFDRLLPALTQY